MEAAKIIKLTKANENISPAIAGDNTTPTQGEGLKRELGVMDIATTVVNITIGSGIFLLPGLVAAILGSASIVAYLFCGLLYFCIMLCYAEMSSRITNSGGAYVYIEKAFGPFAGFVANNLYWFCGALLGAAYLTVSQTCFPSLSQFSMKRFTGLYYLLLCFHFYLLVILPVLSKVCGWQNCLPF